MDTGAGAVMTLAATRSEISSRSTRHEESRRLEHRRASPSAHSRPPAQDGGFPSPANGTLRSAKGDPCAGMLGVSMCEHDHRLSLVPDAEVRAPDLSRSRRA